MRGPGKQVSRLIGRPLLTVLLLTAIAILVLGGCARSRSTASQSWSGVATEGAHAYVGTREGRLIQLSLETGTPVSAPFVAPETDQNSAAPAFYGTPAVADGRVYVAGYHGVVFSLDAEGLGTALSFEIDGDPLAKGVAGEVVVSGDRLVIAAAEGANEGRLYIVDAATMQEVCRYPLKGLSPIGQMWTSPTVANGVAYFGDLGREVHAVRVEDCTAAWTNPVELPGAVVAPPVIVDGNLYVGTFDRKFYRIDAATGASESRFDADGWFWAEPANDGERLYVPSLDGHLYAYDLATGSVVWTYPEQGDTDAILSAPVVVDGLVVVGDDSGTISVLRASDGQLVRDRLIGDKIRAPITADGSVVLIHSLDDKVTAFDISTGALVWDRDLDDVR